MSVAPSDPPRMRITGLHHVTLISSSLERTTAFYRDLLGLSLLERSTNADDPDARHFWFGDEQGSAGTLVSFLEYPQLAPGAVGPGSTHHLALAVGSPEELEAWGEHLGAHGVRCTGTFDRGPLRSIYLRDPDGHILELTTAAP